jgi:hypothetical protein
MNLKSNLWAFAAGLLFGLGLIISGMTDPAKVIAFLDFTGVAGGWDPSLALVMGGAVSIHFVLFRVITKRASPLFDTRFHLPTRTDLDPKLITGSAIFGLGWGLGGYCPGPGLVSVPSASIGAIAFVAAMTLGMWLQHRSVHWFERSGSLAPAK